MSNREWIQGFLLRLDSLLVRPWIHFGILLAVALAFYGHTLQFGLVYDDRSLLAPRGSEWLTSPWHYPLYYRPLQWLLFAPALVTRAPWWLHLQNLMVGTAIVFLYGRLLLRLGFGARAALLVELGGLVLPTSLTLFTWISQRTEWPTHLLGLGVALVLLSPGRDPRVQLAFFAGASLLALFAKESAIAILVLAPLLAAVHLRRGALALVLAGLAAAVLAAYLAVRAQVGVPVPGHLDSVPEVLFTAVTGILSAAFFSFVQVSFTYSPIVLALNLAYLALGIAGARAMLRAKSGAARALLCIFAAFLTGSMLRSEPRNLVVPGLVALSMAAYGAWRVLVGSAGPMRKTAVGLAFALNLIALATLSAFQTYALQDWIEPINHQLARAHPRRPPRGNLYDIDVNTAFRRDLKRWLLERMGKRSTTAGAAGGPARDSLP